MKTIVSSFTALLVLAWGISLAAHGISSGAPAWVAREQLLYLSGLLSIGLMSLGMVLATRPVWLERPFGGMDRVYRAHKWAGMLAAVFAALHWLVKKSSGLLKALIGTAGRPQKVKYFGLLEDLRDAGKELGEFAIYLVLGMVLLSLWRRFPYQFWRYTHRAMPVLYLMVAFHAAVLAPLWWWLAPSGLALGVLLAAGIGAAGLSLSGRIGRG